MTSSTGQCESLDCTHASSSDCRPALPSICWLTKAMDCDAVVAQIEKQGMEMVIPPRSHRKETWDYNRALYKLRHLEENAFQNLQSMTGCGNQLRQE